jgi:hypothetical protein
MKFLVSVLVLLTSLGGLNKVSFCVAAAIDGEIAINANMNSNFIDILSPVDD